MKYQRAISKKSVDEVGYPNKRDYFRQSEQPGSVLGLGLFWGWGCSGATLIGESPILHIAPVRAQCEGSISGAGLD